MWILFAFSVGLATHAGPCIERFRRALKDANACCVRLHAAPSAAAAQPVGGGCPCRPCAQPYRGRSADLRQN